MSHGPIQTRLPADTEADAACCSLLVLYAQTLTSCPSPGRCRCVPGGCPLLLRAPPARAARPRGGAGRTPGS